MIHTKHIFAYLIWLKHVYYIFMCLIHTERICAHLIRLKHISRMTPYPIQTARIFTHPIRLKHIPALLTHPLDLYNPLALVVEPKDIHLSLIQASGVGTGILPLVGDRSSMTGAWYKNKNASHWPYRSQAPSGKTQASCLIQCTNRH